MWVEEIFSLFLEEVKSLIGTAKLNTKLKSHTSDRLSLWRIALETSLAYYAYPRYHGYSFILLWELSWGERGNM
jgi:hypothetical protein